MHELSNVHWIFVILVNASYYSVRGQNVSVGDGAKGALLTFLLDLYKTSQDSSRLV